MYKLGKYIHLLKVATYNITDENMRKRHERLYQKQSFDFPTGSLNDSFFIRLRLKLCSDDHRLYIHSVNNKNNNSYNNRRYRACFKRGKQGIHSS